MEKIKVIHFSHLRNEEHFEYLTQFKTLVGSSDPAIENLLGDKIVVNG